jgi:hypothetical protein
LAVPVLAHRIILTPEEDFKGRRGVDVVELALAEEPPPIGRVDD